MSRYLERKLQAARTNAEGDGAATQQAAIDFAQPAASTAASTMPPAVASAISATSRAASRPRPVLPPVEQRAVISPTADVNFSNLAQTLRGAAPAATSLNPYTSLPQLQSQLRGTAGPPDGIDQADILQASRPTATTSNGLAAGSDDLAQLRKVVRKLELHKTQTVQQPQQRVQHQSQLRGAAPITVHQQHPAAHTAALNDSYVDDDDEELNEQLQQHPQPNGESASGPPATHQQAISNSQADNDILPTDISSSDVVQNPQRLQTIREKQYQGQAAGAAATNTTIYAPADARYMESKHTGEFLPVQINNQQQVTTHTIQTYSNPEVSTIEQLLVNAVNHTQSRLSLILLLAAGLLVGCTLLQVFVIFVQSSTSSVDTTANQLQFLKFYTNVAYGLRQLTSILTTLCFPISAWRLLLERNTKTQRGWYNRPNSSRVKVIRNWLIAISYFVAYLCTLIMTPIDDELADGVFIAGVVSSGQIDDTLNHDITRWYGLATLRFTAVMLAWSLVAFRFANAEYRQLKAYYALRIASEERLQFTDEVKAMKDSAEVQQHAVAVQNILRDRTIVSQPAYTVG